ncbi:MAG: site-specific integrase [Pseudolabrys sp.]
MAGNQRLLRRKGFYYYRRRVPLNLVKEIGKQFVQHSLNTTSLGKAKQLRALRDLEWDARFDSLQKEANPAPNSGNSKQPVNSTQLSDGDLLRLVREYVERKDEEFRKRFAANPPESQREKAEMSMEAKLDAQIIRDRDDPQADQWVFSTGKEILQAAGKSIDDPALPYTVFAEWVRRGLLELDKRSLARLADDHRHAFFDQLFNPSRQPPVSFGELADQYLQLMEEEAATNRLSQKGIDRQHATVSLIREIIGDSTPVDAVDYDTCLTVRSTLARIPANRTKIYGTRPLDEAIERAAAEKKALLSPVTQQQYLAALRDVLDLAAKKRLIPINPAEGLKPIKRDTIAAGEKRRPFTLEQIKQFFHSKYYSECAKHSQPFAHDKSGWRFWLPLICLFTGMRPNEAAQMHLDDLKCTGQGTWYLDIVATGDDDDSGPSGSTKTLKTAASRRRIPVHPELIKIGFLQFVQSRKKTSSGPRMFPELKPDKYGNHASYALKRFRDTYLPSVIKMEPRQSFYSFRHSWRDALRRIDAQPATLQALGAWSQGKLTSDDYGDKSDPDYQAKFVKNIAFPGLDLSPLFPKSG